MELKFAESLAKEFIAEINPYVYKAEIAGSIRRKKPLVADIEIVAKPMVDLHSILMTMAKKGDITLDRKSKDGKKAPFGPKYYRLTYEGFPIDLFCVTHPADWGIIFTIRTGPKYFSQWIVTEALRKGMKVQDGVLWKIENHPPFKSVDVLGGPIEVPVEDTRTRISCPTEKDFFEALGISYVEPEMRERTS